MKLLAFIPIKITLLLILGILIAHFAPIRTSILLLLIISLFLLLGLVFIFGKKTNTVLFGCIAAATIIAMGAFSYSFSQPMNRTDHYSKLNLKPTAVWNLKIKEVLAPNQFTKRYYASVIGVDTRQATGKILMQIPIDSLTTNLNVDDEITFIAELQPINPPLNPHQFNYRKYLERLGIYHQLRIPQAHYIKTKAPVKSIAGIAANARTYIINKLGKEHFGPDEFAVLQALLLGQRNDLSPDTYRNYQKAGAVHILALSGLHIGILMGLVHFLLSPLKYIPKGRTLILIISVLLIWGFAFLSGLSASIIRATTMFTFVAYALYLNRPNNSFNILALSVLFILLFIDSNLLFQVGFQMSYAAVFAILLLYPRLQKLWLPKNKVVRYFWQLLSVSLAAQIGVLPISLYYFHQFPGLFFVSNLLIVPSLGLILGIGVLVIFLSLLNWLPPQITWLYNEIIRIMNSLVGWVAKQESFIFESIPFDFVQLFLSFLILLLIINATRTITYRRLMVVALSIILFQSWTLYQEYDAGQRLEVVVLHQTKNSILYNRNGLSLTVLAREPDKVKNLVKDYQIGERTKTIKYDSLANSYTLKDSLLLILDHSGVYSPTNLNSKILLTQSPKINLERLIEDTRPIEFIADGSNFRSYIERWQSTCLKYKVPFHYTGEKGAYYFK